MIVNTKGKTASGIRYSIFAWDNPSQPRQIKIHAELPDMRGAVQEIAADIARQLPVAYPHDIELFIYSNEPNSYHIKGRGQVYGWVRAGSMMFKQEEHGSSLHGTTNQS